MKYFKTTGDLQKDLRTIAGEMVNIELNKKYFENGELLDSCEKNYNSYAIDGIEYNIKLNVGVIYIYSDSENKDITADALSQVVSLQANKILQKEKKYENTIHISPSDFYTIIEKTNDKLIRRIRYYSNSPILFTQGILFEWFIVDNKNGPLPILDKKYKQRFDWFYSINSIILDLDDKFKYTHNYRFLDFPAAKDLKDYNKSFYSKIYKFSPNIKLLMEFDERLMGHEKYNYYQLKFTELAKNMPIIDMKFEDIPYFYSQRDIESWALSLQTFNLEKHENNLTDDYKQFSNIPKNFSLPRSKKINHPIFKHRCFMTNLPLYDDIYVLCIYKIKDVRD